MASLVTNAKTIVATAPTAATQVLSIAPAGPIQDQVGNAVLLLLKLEEAKIIAQKMIAATDASDPNLTTLNTIVTNLA